MRSRLALGLGLAAFVAAALAAWAVHEAVEMREALRPFEVTLGHEAAGIEMVLRYPREAGLGAAMWSETPAQGSAMFRLSWPDLAPMGAEEGLRFNPALPAHIGVTISHSAYDGRLRGTSLCSGPATHRLLPGQTFGLLSKGIRDVGEPDPTELGSPTQGPFPYPALKDYRFLHLATPRAASTIITCNRDRPYCSAQFVYRGLWAGVIFDRGDLANWRDYRAGAETWLARVLHRFDGPSQDWQAYIAEREALTGMPACVRDGEIVVPD